MVSNLEVYNTQKGHGMPYIQPTTFSNRDEDYAKWLTEHPNGFVVNSGTPPTATYLVLHRSKCTQIDGSDGKTTTSHQYSKTCSDSIGDLMTWADQLGGKLTYGCSCHP